MRLRLPAVLLLTALALGVRGTSIYLHYLSRELSSQLPFKTSVVGGAIVVNSVDPGAECYRGWNPPDRPDRGDRVVAVYDHHGRGGMVRGLFDYGLYLKPINIEEPWTLVVDRTRPGGTARLSLAMPPTVPIVWGPAEWLANLATDFYLPFLAIATGCLIGLLRWRDNQAWLASLLFFALGLAQVTTVDQFPPGWRAVALFLQVSAVSLLPYLVFRFFLRFPTRSPIDRAVPWLNPFFAAAATITLAARLVYEFARRVSLQSAAGIERTLDRAGVPTGVIGGVFTALAALMLLTALLSVVLNARRATSRDERRRLWIVAAGAVVGLLPVVLLLVTPSSDSHPSLGLLVIAMPLAGLFPLSFAYAVLRHRVFGIRLILRNSLTYALVSRGFLVAEGLVIFLALLGSAGTLLQWVEPQPSMAASTAGTALATFMLTVGIRRVNRRVLPVIDRRFFRDAYDGRRVLNDLSRAVRRMASQPEHLLSHVAGEVMTALHPVRLAIFVRPDACSRLVPLQGNPFGRLEVADAPGSTHAFALLVDEQAGGHAAREPRPGRALPPGWPSLASHLVSAGDGEPEAFEVVFDERGEVTDSAPTPGDEETRPGARESRFLAHFDARLVVPLVTSGRTLGFLLLGEKRSEEPYTREDKELLLSVAGQVAIALDYAQLIQQAAEQAALRREVQIAQEVQRQLFPHERPPMRSLRYSGVCRAARGVGGDFYDFLPLSRGALGIALADIAGKGLPAALLMASLQALLRSHAPTHSASLEDLAQELNRHLLESSDGARFASLFFGVYDDDTHLLRYVNAGHLPPIVVGSDSSGGSAVRRLESGGMVLGLFAGQQYRNGCATMQRGDRLLVFSDGVTEATSPAGEMFGEQRLLSAILSHADQPVEELPACLLEAVARFVGPSPQQDDITVIAAEVV